MKIVFLLGFFLGVALQLVKAAPDSVKSYDRALFEVYNLRTNEARKLLESNEVEFSLYKEYVYNLSEVVELSLYEEEDRFEEYIYNLKIRLDRIDTNANKISPEYHIIMGDIFAHAAMAHIINNEFLAGFRKLLKANKNARLNEKKHPDYWLNNKLNGTLNICFDMMTPILKTLSSMFGLKGDATKGYKQLDRYLLDVEGFPGLKSEALLYYVFALKLAKDEERAYKLLNSEIDTTDTPALATFLASSIMFRTARNEEALTYLSYFPVNDVEIPFHHFDYLTGKEKLNRLDADAAIYLERFLVKSKSKNFQRDVCMKLAHHYLILGNKGKYDFYKQKTNEYHKATTDRDREADVEFARPYPLNTKLLKSRYLVQGGYYKRAEKILNEIEYSELTNQAYINEYHLHKAIICAQMHSDKEALRYCEIVIKQGEKFPEHYASEAALLAGNIYLMQGDFTKATEYLKKSKRLDGQGDVYIEVIHKRANNQLNKIRNAV